MKPPKHTLPSLSTVAGRAMAQLSQRSLIISISIFVLLALAAAAFSIWPIQRQFSSFSTDTRKALAERNQELVQSAVEQSAGNMIRLLGAAENAVQQMAAGLESPKLTKKVGTTPLEREFYPGGHLIQTLKKADGYQSGVTFEYPQIKTTDAVDQQHLADLWPYFLSIAKPLHNFHPEIKWLYLGTNRGSFLVFPSSPEIPAGYDPRERPWYTEAKAEKRLIWTSPYFTAGGNDLVLTATQALRYGPYAGSVVGVDLVMADVINNLLSTPYCQKCTFYLVNQKNEILGKRGDKAVGDTWTQSPSTRSLSDDLSASTSSDVVRKVSDWLRSNDSARRGDVPSLSRSPKASTLTPEASPFAFFSAPIDALGWKLVGVTSIADSGTDGERVLGSLASLASAFNKVGLSLLAAWLIITVCLYFAYIRLVRVTLNKSLQPSIDQMGELGRAVDQLKIDPHAPEPEAMGKPSLVLEHFAMVSAIRRTLSRLSREAEEQRTLRVQAEVGAQAKQVAHNIRSPLEALELVMPHLGDVPEEKRRIMQNALREIRDLTNQVRNKAAASPMPMLPPKPISLASPPKADRSQLMLLPLVESVISERQNSFPKARIELATDSEHNCFGVFVDANRTEFRSVLSNVINNAVESTEGQAGRVQVSVKNSSPNVSIEITDNGKGIPRPLMPRLTEQGFTFGKPNGNGLGLCHARRVVEDMTGTLSIASEEGRGTTVVLTIPTARPPSWFTDTITIPTDGDLVILDDNETIHDVWKFRLARLPEPLPGLTVSHLRNTSELREWHSLHSSRPNCRYLVDYEIRGDSKNGLDMVEELGIADRSYLVTGHSDEKEVLDRAHWLGVKVVPKELAGTIPIMGGRKA